MGLFDLFRGHPSEASSSQPESLDLSLDALIKALSSKASTDRIYDHEWAPEGGWDAWCAWAYKQGKVHRFVNSLPKNAMAYEFAAAEGDEAATRDGEVDAQVLTGDLPEADLQFRATAEEAGHEKGFLPRPLKWESIIMGLFGLSENQLVIAFLGASFALALNEGIKWWRRPQLIIDFEEVGNKKPYFYHYPDIEKMDHLEGVAGYTHHYPEGMGVRLLVKNRGKTPAKNCVAKLRAWEKGDLCPDIITMGWSSRSEKALKDLPYSEKVREKIRPITIRPNDSELLDFLILDFHRDIETRESIGGVLSSWGSLPRYWFARNNVKHEVEIKVTAENTWSKPFRVMIQWDNQDSVKEIEDALKLRVVDY